MAQLYRWRTLAVSLTALVLWGGAPDPARTQQPGPLPPDALPPIGWTCPMHREIHDETAGLCPLCGMALVPTRVRPAWSCPLHAIIIEREPGTCPICRRDLVEMTVEVAWVCPRHPDERELEPGRCRICQTELVEQQAIRPHADHNPKHGGLFFMAPDQWHHLEGTYPEPGTFRVYLYNNYSRPLSGAGFAGRAVVREEFDPAAGESHELEAYPLQPSPDGAYLEARIGDRGLPARVTAKLAFAPGGREDRFDFVFPELSREPLAGAGSTVGFTTAATAGDPVAEVSRLELTVPDEPDAIAEEIVRRDRLVQQLIDQGAWGYLYIAALQAKDLALALEDRLDRVPAGHRAAVRIAARRLVRAAWLLDSAGDLGNAIEVRAAYRLFEWGVADIKAAMAIP